MARDVSHFVNTSADDCRISLEYTTTNDLPVLFDALEESNRLGHKTRSMHIARRIKKLERQVV